MKDFWCSFTINWIFPLYFKNYYDSEKNSNSIMVVKYKLCTTLVNKFEILLEYLWGTLKIEEKEE